MPASNYFLALDKYLEECKSEWLSDDDRADSSINTSPRAMGGRPRPEEDDSSKHALKTFLEKTKTKTFFSALANLKDEKKSNQNEMLKLEQLNTKSVMQNEHSEYVELYKRSFVSKSVFCNIYKGVIPEKDTVIKFALGLEADLQKAEILLKYAGYALGDCIKRDLIFKFCFENKITDILEVCELLEYKNEKSLVKKPFIVKLMM